MTQTITPCGAESPHAPLKVKRQKWYEQIPVQCNRAFGHEGDHMYSTLVEFQIYRWTQQGEVIR